MRTTILIKLIISALLVLFFSGCIDDSQQYALPAVHTTPFYKTAYSISTNGLGINSSNNTQLISELNNGYWQGNESSDPFQIYITYHDVTRFDYVEALHKYNSSVGVSTHEIIRYIWCENHNDWIALESFSNEQNWYYHSKSILDSSHYIMANGTVVIKYDHVENGNANHRMFIDVSRLVEMRNI
jgi:hypothetical protein